MKQNTYPPSCKLNLRKIFVLICTTLVSTLSFAQAGNAPMQALPNFPGQFAIDGFLQRQGVNGDWVAGPGGATNIVFTDAGVPLVPLAYLLTDLWDDLVNDDIFDGGNKLFQNPNDWGWRSQKPPAKDDIHNAGVFIALNPANNHIWLAISGDRLSTNGTSYLDFEFYQNTITKTGGPIPGGTGGFNSTGPHNGRTVGDLSITLEFTAGGSFATVKYLQWQPGAEAGSYDYFPLNPPAGTAYAAANGGAAPINVPYGAFGGTTYETLQFVEGAIDLTTLIGGTGLPTQCGSLPFKTLFIKTKSSAERTADLKDFISPFQINVCFDNTPPVLNCPPTLSLGCNPTIPGPSGATASDNCNGSIAPVSADGPVTSTGCGRSMTRIWRATDACGNASTCGQLITWTEDHTAPVFTGSYANVDLGCNPANPGGSLGSASASDACGAPTLSISDGSISSDGCSRSQTRTWTARDACGNTSTASRTVNWIADLTPPTLTTGGTGTSLGCNPSAGDINGALGTAAATDACGVPTVSSSDGSVTSDGCSRSQTRTFRAIDACGNTSTASRTVNWIADLTPPVLTTGGTGTSLGCNPSAGDINGALGTATAMDACGVPTVSSSDGSVSSNGCSRSQTRTFRAIDACGNTSTASRTVNWIADLTPPVLTTGGTGTSLGCNPSAGDINGALGTATATDACGVPTVSSSDGSVTSDGCSRSQTRTFRAIDACGNTVTATRTVTFINDPTPPVFTGSYADVNLGCNPANPDGSLGTATATDGCSNPTITSSDGAVVSDGCNRSTTRTFTVRDACNNTATTSRTVRWTVDVIAPVINGVGGNSTMECPATPQFSSPTASDACGTPTLTFSDQTTQGICINEYTVKRTWRAVDDCGNTSTASQTITIEDNTAPILGQAGANTTINCPSIPQFTPPSVSDCDQNPILTFADVTTPGSCAGTYSTTRTWRASDHCGNTSTVTRSQTITVQDITPPTLNCPANKTINAAQFVATGCADDFEGGGAGTVDPTISNLPPIQNSKVDFRQPRNQGHPSSPLQWTNGVNNQTQAEYFEGMGVPQRIIFTQLQGMHHEFRFRHEAVKHQSGNRHAYDFMMSWEQAVATAVTIGNGSLNELQDLLSQTCNEGISATAGNACTNLSTIPAADSRVAKVSLPDNMGNPPNHHGNNDVNNAIEDFELVYGDRKIEIRGDKPITSFTIEFEGYSGRDDGDNYAWYTIRWTSASNDVMIKLAPRAATGAGAFGYGTCFGAGDINGGPYHFKLDKLDNHSLGERDNQLHLDQYCNVDIPFTFDTPTVSDNCDQTPTVEIVSSDVVTVNPDGSKTHCRTWKATDDCGNTSTCSQCITIECKNVSVYTQNNEYVRTSQNSFENNYVSGSVQLADENLRVTAYQNPDLDNFSLKVNSPVSGQALIGFYTMNGVKIGEMKRDVVARQDVGILNNIPAANKTGTMYTVAVGSHNAKGFLLGPN